MKRYVLTALLSTAYVATLVLVFSSEYGEQNSFLFKEVVAPTETMQDASALITPSFIAPLQEENLHLNSSDEGHSPESAE